MPTLPLTIIAQRVGSEEQARQAESFLGEIDVIIGLFGILAVTALIAAVVIAAVKTLGGDPAAGAKVFLGVLIVGAVLFNPVTLIPLLGAMNGLIEQLLGALADSVS